MSRKEFSKETRRTGLKRSDGGCEAEGVLYGLREGERCNVRLAYGVEFDHVLACSNGGDNSLSNLICACPRCHNYKTRNHDTPRAAKIKTNHQIQGVCSISIQHETVEGLMMLWLLVLAVCLSHAAAYFWGRVSMRDAAAKVAGNYKRDASFDDSSVGALEHNSNQVNISNAIREIEP